MNKGSTMPSKSNDNIRPLKLADGTTVNALYPRIVSASRSTDIPAFYLDWFFKRLDAGYSIWTNPFNGKQMYVAYADTRFIVFWSKNPAPLLPRLNHLARKGLGCYVQYTLNDYVREGYEPNVPPLEERLETFRQLSRALGSQAVIWRFDPLLLTDRLRADDLLRKIACIGNALHGYAEKLVFSFADINCYRKVRANLLRKGIRWEDWTSESMRAFAAKLQDLNTRRGWGYVLATCAEEIDLDDLGIAHNRCIDDRLMLRLAPDDAELRQALGYELRQTPGQLPLSDQIAAHHRTQDAVDLGHGRLAFKTGGKHSPDSGQRKACGCVTSKDIGQYNTCKHGCVYCYANSSEETAMANHAAHTRHSDAPTVTPVNS